MDAAQHKKIMGYFIEEAKEHLETLEDGILDLSQVAKDTEMVNELFRAAHSIKGGSAMLGYSGIQKTSHRLEDAFKLFKEQAVPVDQTLETLFFDTYDVLKDLIYKLERPEGLQPEEADQIYQESEPTFLKLQKYLDQILGGAPVSDEDEVVSKPSSAPQQESKGNFSGKVKVILKQMLDLFKQKPTPENRQQLGQLCSQLAKLESSNEKWQHLLKTAYKAIANPKYPYKILAPVIIKEVKQASDLIVLSQAEKIAPSKDLEKLAGAALPQILITVEPEAAATALKNAFNKTQLSKLVQLLGV